MNRPHTRRLEMLEKIWNVRLKRKRPRPENVIMIVVDALRHDGLSCFGNARKTSPNIDSLARKGIIFENAVSASGSTPGAMGAIMASRYPLFVSDIFNEDQTEIIDCGYTRFRSEQDKPGCYPDGMPTLASILKEYGYETAGFSSNPFLTRELNFARGFDSYEEFPGEENWKPYPNAETVTTSVIDRFSRMRRSKFFMYIHYMDVHHPYSSLHPFGETFGQDFIKGKSDGEIDSEWFHSKDPVYLRKISRHARAMYDSQIRFLDFQLGRLFKTLRRKGILKRSLVLILSDHGDEFLEHGGTVHYPKLYEELVRIPLIMYCPQIAKAEGVSRLVRSVDVLPTVLDALGIETGHEFDGSSLIPVIRGDDAVFPDYAYMDAPPFRAVRTEKWKLIRNERTSRIELYDLADDPFERNDVADSNPSVTSDLLDRLDAVVARLGSASRIDPFSAGEGSEMSEEITKKLKGLGYL